MYVGDFDGDDAKDVAVLVKRRTDGKEGMVVLWQSGAPSTVLGAGNTFGNGGDDFSWLDLWGIEFNASLQESYYEAPVRLEADALVVAKEASSSALIYFVKGEPKWQQQGD